VGNRTTPLLPHYSRLSGSSTSLEPSHKRRPHKSAPSFDFAQDKLTWCGDLPRPEHGRRSPHKPRATPSTHATDVPLSPNAGSGSGAAAPHRRPTWNPHQALLLSDVVPLFLFQLNQKCVNGIQTPLLRRPLNMLTQLENFRHRSRAPPCSQNGH